LFSKSLVFEICVIGKAKVQWPQGCLRFNCRYQVSCFYLRLSSYLW